jgi:ATP-dependent helicase/nuclease subunit B
LIAGPAESAGLTADAVWFLGANEDAWPARGATHPLLPIGVQRENGMPHASQQVDWDLAEAMTGRLLAAAPEIHFSYARLAEGVDTRPSRLIERVTGAPQAMPAELFAESMAPPITVPVEDSSRVPFPPGDAAGGSGILTSQSQCAFKAFATARLGAEKWDAAEAGLTALERGLLLHEAMHRIWAGPPDGIGSHEELAARTDLESFVADHVRRVLREETPARARESMPPHYLELEGERLTTLVTEWLRYEQTRVPFTVAATELKENPTIAGLALRLRLDRVDRLTDDSLLVVDYKTGDVSAKSWDLPRPDDVQLPLYAGFGIDRQMGEVGGLVFAKLRSGNCKFDGRVKAAKQTLQAKLHSSTNLVRKPLTPEDMAAWREEIERLAKDFLAGRANVDPREYPKTCERCELYALCRIQEMRDNLDAGEGANGQEGGDE